MICLDQVAAARVAECRGRARTLTVRELGIRAVRMFVDCVSPSKSDVEIAFDRAVESGKLACANAILKYVDLVE